ncbi:MAG: glycosyltransferase family 2 protein [Bacteroidetes bacterium]|nr:glycosyltransferase family 2 protein [Bacteroidota bacterium]
MKLSIVIPTYRSEANLPTLLQRLNEVLMGLRVAYEIIVVNDHSPDATLLFLRNAVLSQPNLRVISLSRNFGQQIAITAGLKYATGDAVVIMDDDLQDPPEFIPVLMEHWTQGYDIVYAIKSNRKEGILKKAAYKMFYKFLSGLSEVGVPQDSGDFCIMSRSVVLILNQMPEHDRFVRGLRAWVGFRQLGIPCDRARRNAGKPAYTLGRMIKLSLDGIISLSDRPLKFILGMGVFTSLLGVGTFVWMLQGYLNSDGEAGQSIWMRHYTLLGVLMLIGGLIMSSMGLMGIYIGRILNEVRGRPLYLVHETLGFERPEVHTGSGL